MPGLRIVIVLLLLIGGTVAAGQQAPPATVSGVFDLVRVEFQKRNHTIAHATVTELRQIAGGAYVVLAWGVTADSTFRGDFEDELHGVFLVNPTLTRVDRVLDISRTPRWGDYRFWIDKLTDEEVIVRGEGATYGDGATRRAYTINLSESVVKRIEAAKKVVRLSPGAFRQLPPAVRTRLNADGCQIPQSPDVASPHNVLSGDFAAAGQVDWAVLCSVDGDSSIRVFWGGLAACADLDWTVRDSDVFAVDAGRWRIVIRKTPPADVRSAAKEFDLEVTTPLHDGIDDRYCEAGKWIDLEPH